MRIRGNGDFVNVSRFILGSVDVVMEYRSKPFPYSFRRDMEEQNEAVIEFADSRELDNLIDTLIRFRNESADYIGVWK